MTLHLSPSQFEPSSLQEARELLAEGGVQLSAGERTVTLDPQLAGFLQTMLEQLGKGQRLSLHEDTEELSSQQAANLLQVSRPYLIKLLDEGRIPYRKVGKHRRIRLQDLLDFQERDLAERRAMARKITALAQEMGLEY